jgi:quercetin dioxygenase-like cupin family protein
MTKSANMMFGLMATLSIASGALAQSRPADQTPVTRAGATPAKPGPATTFTGTVSVGILAKPVAPGRTSMGLVTFDPGARSFWHTHPAGQTLYVTEGCGWTQQEGKSPARICAGDTATVPPGVRHWHGATADQAMSHLSITEKVNGREVDWQGPVSSADYHGPETRP